MGSVLVLALVVLFFVSTLEAYDPARRSVDDPRRCLDAAPVAVAELPSPSRAPRR